MDTASDNPQKLSELVDQIGYMNESTLVRFLECIGVANDNEQKFNIWLNLRERIAVLKPTKEMVVYKQLERIQLLIQKLEPRDIRWKYRDLYLGNRFLVDKGDYSNRWERLEADKLTAVKEIYNQYGIVETEIFGVSVNNTRDVAIKLGQSLNQDQISQAIDLFYSGKLSQEFTISCINSFVFKCGAKCLLNTTLSQKDDNFILKILTSIPFTLDILAVVKQMLDNDAKLIYDNIKNYADKVFLLTGSQTKKQQKMIRQEMNSISNDESMILVATGQLVGEGFDFPRLDTLIMATPVAWKGLVEQYAGRLNRDYEGKENVVIFDYIDSNIRVFDNMYAKRLKAYKRIGYSLQGEPDIQKQKANAIYDYESYAEVYCRDLADAKTSIVVSSPSLRYRKVNTFINDMKPLQEKGVTITVLTWNPDSYNFGSSIHKMEILRALNEAGIEVVLKEENCLHFAVIDNSIVWYGSLNLLGKEDVEDNIMRIYSDEIAAELFELSFGRRQCWISKS